MFNKINHNTEEYFKKVYMYVCTLVYKINIITINRNIYVCLYMIYIYVSIIFVCEVGESQMYLKTLDPRGSKRSPM